MSVISPNQTRIGRLARKLESKKFRDSYMSRQIRAFLAAQIRAVRGTASQAEFGKAIGKPQSVVSRLEDEDYGVSIRTLIDIAQKSDIGLIVRFVDFPTFLKITNDLSDSAFAPQRYVQDAINELAEEEERRAVSDSLAEIFRKKQIQPHGTEAHIPENEQPSAGSFLAVSRPRQGEYGQGARSGGLGARRRQRNPQPARPVQAA